MDPLSLMLGLGGIGANLFGQSRTNEMQAHMMQQQQSFQERMSSTAYQRASADMQAAGLNPMMMFSSGSAASTPAGASPSPMVKSGLDADSFQKSINTGVQARVANATIDQLTELAGKAKADAAVSRAEEPLMRERTLTQEQETRYRRWLATNEGWKTPIIQSDAERSKNVMGINGTARRWFDQGAYLGGKASETIRPITDVISSAKDVVPWTRFRRWPHPREYDRFD